MTGGSLKRGVTQTCDTGIICLALPAARCYSGSRDQVEIDQKREYISVNGKTTFSSLQTMW